jgi:hypothetical protein
MKFLKENWYKLMTGTAMLIFACGFFIYAVSPSYANEISEVNKPQMGIYEDAFSVASGGYLYTFHSKGAMHSWCAEIQKENPNYDEFLAPTKRKLP